MLVYDICPTRKNHHFGSTFCFFNFWRVFQNILINFQFAQVEDINLVYERDYILVRDGNHPKSPLLQTLTGNRKNNPRVVMSTGNELYLYFKTSLGESQKGFKIKYAQGKINLTSHVRMHPIHQTGKPFD